MILFEDRRGAGRLLGEELRLGAFRKPVVFGLPRGGVPVAYEVAQKLECPLDTIVVRKLGVPGNPEFAIGAIAPEHTLVIDRDTIESIGVTALELDRVIAQETEEMNRRILVYKSGAYAKGLKMDEAIIVDDGIATGASARAAIQYARTRYAPQRIVFATPLCANDTAAELRGIAQLVCLHELDNLGAIGTWYRDFEQVEDDVVRDLLDRAARVIK